MSTLIHFESFGAALAGNRQSAIVYARADGGIGFWNASAEALFGHSSEEAVGKRIDLIVPEEYQAMHWAGFGRAIGSAWRGSSAWGPVEGLHKSGERVPLRCFSRPFRRQVRTPQACSGSFALRVLDSGHRLSKWDTRRRRRDTAKVRSNLFDSQTVTADNCEAGEEKMSAQRRPRQLVCDARLSLVEAVPPKS
jgi:PAS domain S-box-containing protein